MTDAATLIRCPSCLTPIYAGEKNCRHCGVDLTRPRPILTRRAWFMIGIAVLGFALADTVYLVQRRKSITNADGRILRDFLQSVFHDDVQRAALLAGDGSELRAELPALRKNLHVPDGPLEAAVTGFTRLESRATHAFRFAGDTQVSYEDARIYRFELMLSSRFGGTTLRFFGEACLVSARGHALSCLHLVTNPLTGNEPHCPHNLDR